ncbi:MAG TPA: cation diffusion facilitator family transporter [Candidatus Omnitrophota bacterium]|nr:cation diffusion facilitator family transporter [Candidatus Omnitrophota bacterium]
MKEYLFQKTVAVGQDIKSPAVIANAWHHRSDALSSVAVFLGIAGAIFLGESWRVLDPLAAMGVSLLIMHAAFSVLKESLNELMEASLNDELEDEILAIIGNIPGVKYPHNLKTRKIGRNIAIDIHIKVSKDLNIKEAHNISTSVEETLRHRFGKDLFVSVHVEPAL